MSIVWGEGRAELTMVPPDGAGPVKEGAAKRPREMTPDEVFLTLHYEDGQWRLGTAAVSGRWLRKTDGEPSTRTGTLMFTLLREEDGAPGWLVARVERLLAALNAAMDAVVAA